MCLRVQLWTFCCSVSYLVWQTTKTLTVTLFFDNSSEGYCATDLVSIYFSSDFIYYIYSFRRRLVEGMLFGEQNNLASVYLWFNWKIEFPLCCGKKKKTPADNLEFVDYGRFLRWISLSWTTHNWTTNSASKLYPKHRTEVPKVTWKSEAIQV